MNLTYISHIRNEVVFGQGNTTEYCEHFSRKKSLKTRIKQVATVSLIFLSMVTGEVFAGDKLPKSKASAGRKKEATFETISLSNALPDVVPSFPLPDLVPSNPPVPSMPPVAPEIPCLLGSASSNAPKQNTGFMRIIR
jgi:hypothetical protein